MNTSKQTGRRRSISRSSTAQREGASSASLLLLLPCPEDPREELRRIKPSPSQYRRPWTLAMRWLWPGIRMARLTAVLGEQDDCCEGGNCAS